MPFLRALLVAVLVVAAFFAGTRFERGRKIADREAEIARLKTAELMTRMYEQIVRDQDQATRKLVAEYEAEAKTMSEMLQDEQQ